MKNSLVVLAVLGLSTLMSAGSRANDSAIQGVGGSEAALASLKTAKPIKGEHPTIRMVREKIAMTVYKSTYDVRVDFEFKNEGAARSVLMGFPEGAGGDFEPATLDNKSAYRNFKSWVDGDPVKTRRVVAESDRESQAFQAYHVKSVRFGRNQTRRVRVSYRAPLGGSVDGSFVYYDFSGGNWKGKVAQSDLSVRFTQPGNYVYYDFSERNKPAHRRDGSTLLYQWKNWEAQDGFRVNFPQTYPGSLAFAETPKELAKPLTWENNAKEFRIAARNPDFDPYDVIAFRRTGYILRDGRTFVSLREFYNQLESNSEKSKKTWNGDLRWDARTQAASVRSGQTRRTDVQVAANSSTMKINNVERKMSAPAWMGGKDYFTALYVPLGDLVNALGGQVKVNAKTRRVWFDVPIQ